MRPAHPPSLSQTISGLVAPSGQAVRGKQLDWMGSHRLINYSMEPLRDVSRSPGFVVPLLAISRCERRARPPPLGRLQIASSAEAGPPEATTAAEDADDDAEGVDVLSAVLGVIVSGRSFVILRSLRAVI